MPCNFHIGLTRYIVWIGHSICWLQSMEMLDIWMTLLAPIDCTQGATGLVFLVILKQSVALICLTRWLSILTPAIRNGLKRRFSTLCRPMLRKRWLNSDSKLLERYLGVLLAT